MIDLKFDNVSKRYRVRQEEAEDSDRHPLVRKFQKLRRPTQDFWALQDVSSEVKRGEAVGIIGHNGAGKSTILKLLANITAPTSGEITINGRLSALIEVGSGFHPELTGRENIYLNGSILGMSRREITEKLDSIVDFAGVRTFLDTPVKRFSSGMYVRLGFSIAAHLEPDILLLDEVLAVGDAAFQVKCLERIEELKQAGTTIVFISHDLGAVESICSRVILMKQGKIAADGNPREVIAVYQERMNEPFSNVNSLSSQNGTARIITLALENSKSSVNLDFRTGYPFTARIDFNVILPIPDAIFEIVFYTADHVVHCECTTADARERISLVPGLGSISFHIATLPLLPGVYYIDATLKERNAAESIHTECEAAVLRVAPGKAARGKFYLAHSWAVEQKLGTSKNTEQESSQNAS